jgi:hypothetical protein
VRFRAKRTCAICAFVCQCLFCRDRARTGLQSSSTKDGMVGSRKAGVHDPGSKSRASGLKNIVRQLPGVTENSETAPCVDLSRGERMADGHAGGRLGAGVPIRKHSGIV